MEDINEEVDYDAIIEALGRKDDAAKESEEQQEEIDVIYWKCMNEYHATKSKLKQLHSVNESLKSKMYSDITLAESLEKNETQFNEILRGCKEAVQILEEKKVSKSNEVEESMEMFYETIRELPNPDKKCSEVFQNLKEGPWRSISALDEKILETREELKTFATAGNDEKYRVLKYVKKSTELFQQANKSRVCSVAAAASQLKKFESNIKMLQRIIRSSEGK